ncbi:MAG: sulfurtransferase [Chloroflexi bacterium]|nr:sulfurtransferase [Chloroflexota bacterium]
MTGDEQLLGWINLGTPAVPTKHKEERVRPALHIAELPPDPLVQVGELIDRLDAPGVVVCDVRWYLDDPARGRREYLEGHIPGARFVDLDTDLADHHDPDALGRHPLPSPVRFAATLARLGIGPDDLVVAYDDGSGVPASRLWWMLDALGYRGARVLDGGFGAWQAAGGPLRGGVEVAPERPVPDAADVPALTWPRTIDRHRLRERLGEVLLLDARAGARYRGEVEPVDPRPGHIPTARSLPATAHVGEDGLLSSPIELAAGFETLGAGAQDVVVSCGSGVTACRTALAMRVAGLPDPLLYPGSYSDWVTAGWPVVTGEEPGDPTPPHPVMSSPGGSPTPEQRTPAPSSGR